MYLDPDLLSLREFEKADWASPDDRKRCTGLLELVNLVTKLGISG